MNNQSKINYKKVTVSVLASDGVELNGEISYWAKDHVICIKTPFEKTICTGHLLYGIAVVYVTTEEPRKGVHYINLIEKAKLALIEAYEGDKL